MSARPIERTLHFDESFVRLYGNAQAKKGGRKESGQLAGGDHAVGQDSRRQPDDEIVEFSADSGGVRAGKSAD